MKKSKFKDSQIIGYIKRAEAGEPVASLCREACNPLVFADRSEVEG